MTRFTSPLCHLCSLSLNNTHSRYCDACLKHFSFGPRCQRCGLPTLEPTELCGECLASPPQWERLCCIGHYQYPLSQLIHQFKYRRQFWQAKPLAELLIPHISDPAPLITSVPLHWQRYVWRGFNQSDLLARALSHSLNIEYWPGLFIRTRATIQQQGLTRSERQSNLRNAFMINSAYPNHHSHVAIIDDVVTTGSTVEHLARMLYRLGVKRIDIYCLCRTPTTNEP
ncbi:ComF family protein [Vibrio sp. CAIM 722]|uniref:ComF family protein n=1 Tax=Vibrio eleionomae TaxID=2653505 RepID=A0A7X4LMJ6_9VIBR|nr:ComF family protein [Vibrio eleionomae]MZI94755.1 ComF family protein [Vibrio eleionomae]